MISALSLPNERKSKFVLIPGAGSHSKRHPSVYLWPKIVSSDFLREIIPRSFHPSPMAIIGISRTTNNFAINFLKFFNSFAKCDNFSGTNESKILWIKEQYNIFSKIIAQFDVNISDVSIFQNGGFSLLMENFFIIFEPVYGKKNQIFVW